MFRSMLAALLLVVSALWLPSYAQTPTVTEAQAKDLADRCLSNIANFVYFGAYQIVYPGPWNNWNARSDPAHGEITETDLHDYRVFASMGFLTLSKTGENKILVGDAKNALRGRMTFLWGPFTTEHIVRINVIPRGVQTYLYVVGTGTFYFFPPIQKLKGEPDRRAPMNFQLLFRQGVYGWDFLQWEVVKPSDQFQRSQQFDAVLAGMQVPVLTCK